MDGYVILIFMFAFLLFAQGASINSQSDQTITYNTGDEVIMKWTYQTKSIEDFVELKCGKYNTSIVRNPLQIIVILNDQDEIDIRQPTFARATVNVKEKIVSLTLSNIKDEATGLYRCQLSVYDQAVGSLQTIESSSIRLVAQDQEAIAASQARLEAKEKQLLMIYIGVPIAIIGLVIIVVVIVVVAKRRNSKGGQKKMSSGSESSLKKKRNKKKLTKQDIQTNGNEHVTSPLYSQNSNEDSIPENIKQQIEIISTPDEAFKRPYHDDDDLRDYV